MEDSVFYVGVEDPVELRRDILHSSKSLIDGLRRYETYKQIREEKLSATIELKRVFDELLVLNRKLRSKLPKIPSEKPQPVEKVMKKAVKKPVKRDHMDLLEEELANIEKRLESLR